MKRLAHWIAAVSAAAVTGCSSTAPAPPPDAPPHRASVTTPSGITIAAVRTGWVAVKEPHWRYSPPGFLVVPRIFLSREWHPWIPNFSYVVRTSRGALLVDTGADPAITDASYMACDPNASFFYRHNMRFVAPPELVIDKQLPLLGIPPERIDTVVVTHFHGDHPGRLGAFPQARVLTGAENWPTHLGAVPCTLPAGFMPATATFPDGPFGAFARSEILLATPSIRLVPLPGHTHGHVGVLVRDGERYWLMAGDATFDRQETDALHVCGVSEDVAAARETQRLIAAQLAGYDTTLLAAHDASVLTALAAP